MPNSTSNGSNSSSSQNKNSQSGNSTRGGTSEQHAKAGAQSHKNDDKNSGSKSTNNR